MYGHLEQLGNVAGRRSIFPPPQKLQGRFILSTGHHNNTKVPTYLRYPPTSLPHLTSSSAPLPSNVLPVYQTVEMRLSTYNRNVPQFLRVQYHSGAGNIQRQQFLIAANLPTVSPSIPHGSTRPMLSRAHVICTCMLRMMKPAFASRLTFARQPFVDRSQTRSISESIIAAKLYAFFAYHFLRPAAANSIHSPSDLRHSCTCI